MPPLFKNNEVTRIGILPILASVMVLALPHMALANENKPIATSSDQIARTSLDNDVEYQSWLAAAGEAEKKEDGQTLAKIVNNIITREVEVVGASSAEVAGSYMLLARAHRMQSHYELALEAARNSLKIINAVKGEMSQETLQYVFALTFHLRDSRRYEEALDLNKRLLEISQKTSGAEHPDTLIYMDQLADTLGHLGQRDDALLMHQRVLQISRKVSGEESADTLRYIQNVAERLQALGRHEEAMLLCKQGLEISRRKLGSEHPDTLEFMALLANNLHGLGRYKEAFEIRKKVLALRRKVLGNEAPYTLLSMGDLASTLSRLGRFSDAYDIQNAVLELSPKVLGDQHPYVLLARLGLANVLQDLGRYEEAIVISRQLPELFRQTFGEKHSLTASALTSLANVLTYFSRYDEALAIQKQTLELSRSEFGDDDFRTIEPKLLLAKNLSEIGRPEEALNLNKQVVALSEKLFGLEHIKTLEAKANLASTLGELGRTEDALEAQMNNLLIARKVLGDEHQFIAFSLNNIAASLYSLDRFVQAIDTARQGLDLQRKALGEKHPIVFDTMHDLTWALISHSQNPTEALFYARKVYQGRSAFDGTEVRREAATGRELLRSTDVSYRFADALWVSSPDSVTSISKTKQAFEALQRGSLGATSQAVAASAAMRHAIASGLGGAAIERRGLVTQWLDLEKQSIKTLSAPSERDFVRPQILTKRMAEAGAKIRAIDTVLKKRAPKYFAILKQTPLRISETRRLLKKGEAILLITPTDFGTHIIALNDNEIIWKRSDLKRGDIATLVSRLRQDLDPASTAYARGPDLSLPGASAMPSFDRKSAHELYAALIQPVKGLIKGSSQIFIVADGALASLPLGVLVTKEPLSTEDDSDPDVLRRTSWLADAYPIVQLPSLQSLSYLRTYNQLLTSQRAETSFVGFGDPLLGGASFERGSRTASLPTVEVNSLTGSGVTANGSPLMDTELLRALPRLPGTARELESVRQSLNAPASSVRVAIQMTESTIKESNLKDVGILHLATHGLTAAQSGSLAEPGLVFTPPQMATPQDDGYLSSSEVIALDLTMTDWVILSACNTGAASGKDGETGLSGLARSFFYAGASTLLVSHWPVDDDVAAKITTSTIGYSRSGMSRSQALQKAMKDIRTSADPRLAHPSVWAPFSILGDGR